MALGFDNFFSGYEPTPQPMFYKPVNPIEEMQKNAYVEQRKKTLLDQLFDKYDTGDYYGTNDSDKTRARGDALVALGQQFLKASQQGTWGAFAGALGTGIGAMGQAYDQSLAASSQMHQKREEAEYTKQARDMQLKRSALELKDAEYKDQSGEEMGKVVKRTLDGYNQKFSSLISSSAIDPEERAALIEQWKISASIAAADPENPQGLINLANQFVTVGARLGKEKEAAREVALEKQRMAELSGVSLEEYTKGKNHLFNVAIQQADAELAQTRALTSAYGRRDTGAGKGEMTQAQQAAVVNRTINDTLNSAEGKMAMMTLQDIAAGAGGAQSTQDLAPLQSLFPNEDLTRIDKNKAKRLLALLGPEGRMQMIFGFMGMDNQPQQQISTGNPAFDKMIAEIDAEMRQ